MRAKVENEETKKNSSLNKTKAIFILTRIIILIIEGYRERREELLRKGFVSIINTIKEYKRERMKERKKRVNSIYVLN